MKQIKFIIISILISSIITPFISLGAEDVIIDVTPPVITLIGEANINITQNDTYIDLGATALDDVDGDITSNIVAVNNVDTTTLGTYTITYRVSDATGNIATVVTRSVEVTPVVVSIPKETILIRNGDIVVWQGDFDLPPSGTIDILDKSGLTHTVNSNSVLGILYALDQSTDTFSISDLQYYSSFNAFYLKCITPKDLAEVCDNWQYVINNATPSSGMDGTILTGGESIGLYFGNPHQVTLDKNSIKVSESFTATAQKYQYEDNTWSPLSGVTIGVTLPNPNDPWNPTSIFEQAVDVDGKATITLGEVNIYTVGIKEDFYFPSYTLTVIENSVEGGGGGGQLLITNLDINKALNFLISKQSVNNSFGSDLYTDWVSIAASAIGMQSAFSFKNSLHSYLSNNLLNSTLTTDNERHAMALMALGIDPYSGTSINYISKIVSSFDSIQFGDTSVIGDDIFALIVLNNAGYKSSDEIMNKDISYIISNQSSDGSWGGIDMTAAGILALRNFQDLPGVTTSIANAENYLIGIQGSDGGFGNSFATSWVLQALSQNPNLSTQVAKADAYIAQLQQSDGGVDLTTASDENRIWATAYAIVGALHKPWNSIMSSYDKRITESNNTNAPPSTITVNTATPAQPEKLETLSVKTEIIETPKEEIIPTPKVQRMKPEITKTDVEVEETKVLGDIGNNLTASVADAESARNTPNLILYSIIGVISSILLWLLFKFVF